MNPKRSSKEKVPDFKKIFHRLLIIIPIGVAGNIAFSIWKSDVNILESLSQMSPEYLILAIFLTMFPWLPDALRVMSWTRFLGHPLSYRDSLRVVIGSELGSAITPTAIGGGYVKLGLLIEKGFSTGQAASLMVLGSLEMGLFFMIVLPIAIFTSGFHQTALFLQIVNNFIENGVVSRFWMLPIGVILLILLFGFYTPFRSWAIRHPWVMHFREKFTRFGQDFLHIYKLIAKQGKKQFIMMMGLTAIQWTSRYMVIAALMASLHLPVNPLLFFALQWAVFSLGTLIPTPGGAVGVEASFYLIYQALIPGNMIGLVTGLWRFFTYYFLLLLDIFLFVIFSLRRDPQKKQSIKKKFKKLAFPSKWQPEEA